MTHHPQTTSPEPSRAGDDHYHKSSVQFDWYQRWADLEATVAKHLKKSHHILIAGCGNSRMAEDMHEAGYAAITCIDISQVVVKQMADLYASTCPALRFMHMNACALEFPDETVDAVIAKATVDVMMCSEGAASSVHHMCLETSRVLRPGGVFIVVSIDETHLQRLDPGLANHDYGWTVTQSTIPKPTLQPGGRQSSLPAAGQTSVHHVYICRKRDVVGGFRPATPDVT